MDRANINVTHLVDIRSGVDISNKNLYIVLGVTRPVERWNPLTGNTAEQIESENHLNWKCPACGNEDNPGDVLRCACGNEVKDNSGYAVEETLDQRQHEALKPPVICPRCGYQKFAALEPEKGTEHTLVTLLGFIMDFFASGPTRSIGLEELNKERPGWMCEKCGFEIRIKTKS